MALDGLTLEIDDWQALPSATHTQRWQRDGDILDITWYTIPPQLPPLTDQQAVHNFLTTQAAASRAALLECQIIEVAGCPTVQSLIKLRDPRPNHQGLLYVGSLMVIGVERSCVIRIQAYETALIGLREALVVAMNPHLTMSTRAGSDANPHLHALLKTAPILAHPADDVRYDHLINQHPLSRVRAFLKQVITSNPTPTAA